MDSPEHNLWFKFIECRIHDAIGKFNLNGPDLETQYNDMRKGLKKSGRKYIRACSVNTHSARYFFETSRFDDLAILLGYDSLFVNKVFAYIHKAITLDKKLYEEFGGNHDRRNS